jgi:hypothetical protein
MTKYFYVLLIITAFIPLTFSQYKLTNYLEENNKITLRITLDACNLSSMTDNVKFQASGF